MKSLLYLTWKTRIERPHQTCFLKKDMQTEANNMFMVFGSPIQKMLFFTFWYLLMLEPRSWLTLRFATRDSQRVQNRVYLVSLKNTRTAEKVSICFMPHRYNLYIYIYVKNIILSLCSRFFPVTFLGVLSDHFRAKWPPFGWSKGHLEEAGYMTSFYVFTYMLSWNIICLSDVVYSTIESRTPKVQRAHPKMKGF